MSWTPLIPVNKTPVLPLQAGISISLSKPQGRFGQILRVAFRTKNIDHPPAWLKAGMRVTVMLGAGDHDGMLRIVPEGEFTLTQGTGVHAKSGMVTLKLSPPAPCKGGPEQPRQMVEYDHADGWIEVTLPKWCWAAWAPAAIVRPPMPAANGPAVRRVLRDMAGPFAVPEKLRPGRGE